MNQKLKINKSLFWDIATPDLDYEKNARFIIDRVITRGNIDDWKAVLNFYGKERVCKEVLLIRSLDSKTANYLSVYFGVAKERFRCCN